MLNVSGVRGLDNGDKRQWYVEFESDILDYEDMLPLKDCTEDEVVLPVEESLIIRRTLQVQVKEDDNDLQRKNIFHTRCYVENKACSLIIDSGSCASMARTTLVSKLNMWACSL